MQNSPQFTEGCVFLRILQDSVDSPAGKVTCAHDYEVKQIDANNVASIRELHRKEFILSLVFVRLQASVDLLKQSSLKEAEVSSLLTNNHMVDGLNAQEYAVDYLWGVQTFFWI